MLFLICRVREIRAEKILVASILDVDELVVIRVEMRDVIEVDKFPEGLLATVV